MYKQTNLSAIEDVSTIRSVAYLSTMKV